MIQLSCFKYVTNCCLLSLLNVINNVLDDNVTQCTDPSRFTEVNFTNKWYQIRLLLLVQSDLGLLCLLMVFLSELFGFGTQKVNTYTKKVKRLQK